MEGALLYSARWLLDNPCNINGAIRETFAKPALPPYLGQQPMVQPKQPENVRATVVDGDSLRLTCSPVDGCYYAVYRSNGGGREASLVGITYEPTMVVPAGAEYLVTAVTRGVNAESKASPLPPPKEGE